MHSDDAVTTARARRVLTERVLRAVHSDAVPLTTTRNDLPGEPIPMIEAIAGRFEPAEPGATWGPAWGTTWFHFVGTIPSDRLDRDLTTEALIDLGFDRRWPGSQCEGLAYRPDGTTIKSINPQNQWLDVSSVTSAEGVVDFYVEAAANPTILADRRFDKTFEGDVLTAATEHVYRLNRADLAVFHRPVFELAMDLDVLLNLQAELPRGPRRARILQALDDSLDLLDLQNIPGTADAARDRLAGVLASPAEASAHRISAIGHAHIDSAWLWPIRETVRKTARTVSSMLDLIDGSEDFLYGMSSAQQYAWLRDHHPQVWERLKQSVLDGRFIPLGGMWVESDTVMPSAESLVRQFLYGQQFFQEEFGVRPRGVWLPDSFGYSPALPQLMRRAGFEWFFTQKMSWNQTNEFPHNTFSWQGIDGSQVLTHFPPMDTYSAQLTGAELARASTTFRESRIADGSIAATGFGDGGGGTTREMLARAARVRDLEGSPTVRWRRPDDFFDDVAADAAVLPVWSGELYLEFHRATLTSQHAMKQGNRTIEQLLVEAELWSSTAAVRGLDEYPHDELDALWRETLLHQFHDILPGTSIAWVHRQARETYTALIARAEHLIACAIGSMAGDGEETIVFNASAFPRAGVHPAEGRRASQILHEHRPSVSLTEGSNGWSLENELVRVLITRDGLVESAIDLESGRETIAPGRSANLLQLHQDLPNEWDAWDVDAFYRNSRVDLTEATSVVADVQDGVASVVVDRTISADSRVRQTLTLHPGQRELVIEQITDWHETEKFLKLSFPLNVRAETSLAETQYGYVARPTHVNTSWDAARFETSMHRYVLVAEPGLGVAVTNDSSYGYDITRITTDDAWGVDLRLSVLRAPQYPDPLTDRGRHEHRFGLVIGADVENALRYGVHANSLTRTAKGSRDVEPIVRIEGDGLVRSSVKLAIDRSGDVIVRAYEHTGSRGSGRLVCDFPVAEVRVANLIEDAEGAPLTIRDGAVDISFSAFEVQSWRIVPDRSANVSHEHVFPAGR